MLADTHRAAVLKLLTAASVPCTHCGAALFTFADTRTDTFEPATKEGEVYGPDPDVAHLLDPAANPLGAVNPYDALAKMAELLDQGHKAVSPGKSNPRACLTPLFWQLAGEYSMLNVRMAMGGGYHVHRPATDWKHEVKTRERPDDLPWHCGWPAWLRPSGWHCRQCKIVLTDATADWPGRCPGPGGCLPDEDCAYRADDCAAR